MIKMEESYRTFRRVRVIGEHTVTLPEPPPIDEIANYYKPQKNQRFIPTKMPEDWDFMDEVQQAEFEEEELRKCDEGYWFFNNGNLEYITGHHYFYINWFTIKVEDPISGVMTPMLPDFMDTDRDFYYLWHFIENNKNIGGLVYVTKRRSGKTYRAAEIIFRRMSQYLRLKAGVQSKNEDDAQDVIQMIIEAMDYMPPFLKPKNDGKMSKAKGINFAPANLLDTKTRHEDKKMDETYMYSSVVAKATTHNAFDSGNLGFYLCDESGKWDKVDVNAALGVVLKTMTGGASITGKCIVTSTVEEMEKKGGDGLKKIWDKADTENLTSYGRTANTLIRHFEPAYRGFRGEINGIKFISEYGYSNEREAKKFLEESRRVLTGDDLENEMRMNPFTVDEAFQIATSNCQFKEKNIIDTLKYNDSHVNEDNLFRGNFHWVSSIDKPEVYFEHDPKGKFYVSRLQDKEKRNKSTVKHTIFGVQYAPTILDHAIGIDPVDNLKSKSRDQSKAAIHNFRKFNPLDPSNSDCFVFEYIHRPETPEEFYEDSLKAAVFYSVMILTESNKSGLNTYLRTHGYYEYLMDIPDHLQTKHGRKVQTEKGVFMGNPKARNYFIGKVKSYVVNNLGYDEHGNMKSFMPFNRTLKTYLAFTPDDWTPHDAFVSSTLALTGAEERVIHKIEEEKIQPILQRYTQEDGLMSKRI